MFPLTLYHYGAGRLPVHKTMRPERPLDVIELRVLGCLLEKQRTTPDIYPLTLNALRSAANQTTNREPIMSVEHGDLASALERLQQLGLAWKVLGGRAVRWDHNLAKAWGLTPATTALIALLLLRGPQTTGELRSRADRMHRFDSVAEVETALGILASGDEPLVTELPRRPGQKENRWTHLVGEYELTDDNPSPMSSPEPPSIAGRVEDLAREVGELRAEVRRLKELLGETD